MDLETINSDAKLEMNKILKPFHRALLRVGIFLIIFAGVIAFPTILQMMNGIDLSDVDLTASFISLLICVFLLFLLIVGLIIKSQDVELQQYALRDRLSVAAVTLNQKRSEEGLDPVEVGFDFQSPQKYMILIPKSAN